MMKVQVSAVAIMLLLGISHLSAQAIFPLKLSPNHRYLTDQNGQPFLIVGDTPQGLMGRLTENEAERYFADREAHGFNTLGWVDVMCSGSDFPTNHLATTPDGLRPFDGFVGGESDHEHYDLSKPDEAYFVRLDHIVEMAAKHHLLVFLAPAETNGWIPTLHNNGVKAAYNWGRYLGTRYRKFDNVMWLSGNDFNTWTQPEDDDLVQAVARGIRSVAPEQMQTVELQVRTSSSFDDPRWVPLIDLNGTYTYSPTYIQMLHSYSQKPIAPVYLQEAHYDLEDVGDPPDFGTPSVLRRQAYWAMLTGGIGQFYGNKFTWSFADGWEKHMDTPAVEQLGIWKKFFLSIPWQNLIPDQDHVTFVNGFGEYGNVTTRVSASDYGTAAGTADGSTIVVYIPTARAVTINMTKLASPARARWFDPTDGSYHRIEDSPISNRGNRQFFPPGKNRKGDDDWVLLLQTDANGRADGKAP